MKAFTTLLTGLAALVGSVAALPINGNGTAAYPVGDVNVLQFALTLEYLEINLYETLVNKYSNEDFQSAGFKAADRDTFLQIIQQELDHIAVLRSAVRMQGAEPVGTCKYDYGNTTSLNQLLNVTDAVNGLGPSAYLGAGAFIESKLILTQGASLGNIETRHNSWLNGLLGRSEQPTPFLVPLTPTQAYGVASQFIVTGSCSPNLKAVTAYPPTFRITNPGWPAKPVNAGDNLMFQLPEGINADRAAFIYSFNTTIVDLNEDGSATIPSDLAGQAYIVLTTATNGETLNDQNSLTAPQAFYVDAPAQAYSGQEVGTYTFSE